MPAIFFDRASKCFPRHRGQLLLRDRLKHLLRPSMQEKFCALQDITFTVESGESVAIVGHNGAGKSTLLNLATRLARPDKGSVVVEGKVAPLLELGSGFHPDLTGVENVHINAAMLGLSRRQMHEAFDSIVEFSEIGNFIFEPLRTYSSGMVMRLAFSVAVHVDPEILIIDEILGVGDYSFFNKSVNRLLQFRHAGKTLLCVSHSPDILQKLCDRAIWLDHGRIVDDGPTARVLKAYEERAKSALEAHA